jgi:dipeptidyl aminopeptidase/acylaminoacyl peptidase
VHKSLRLSALGAAALAVGAAAVPAPARADLPPLVDVKDFFKNPQSAGYQLSPHGEYLAYLAPWNNRLNVWVKKIAGGEPVRITNDQERDIRSFTWTTDDRIVYGQDTAGDENFKLFSIKRDGTGIISLTPWDKVKADVVDVPRKDPRHILIQHNHRNPEVFDVFRVDVETGKSTLLIKNPGDVSGYVTDHDGVIRIETVTDGVNAKILYRPDEKSPFKTVISTNFREQVSPELFTFDNKHLIATSNIGRDKQALVELDPATGKEVKVIYENPEVDVDGAISSEARKKLTGAVYETDKQHYVFFDATREALQKDLEAKLPGVNVAVAGTDLDEKVWLVKTWGDRTRGDYYLYDGKTRQLDHLASVTPWLDAKQMAEMTPVTYQSRDGLTIHGYLTLPSGVEAKSLPLIVNPHGGPWVRDSWGFDPEVQFLANRGYAVLQINYRGSTGYGRKFWEAGFGEWGKSMQDDLTDGANEMVKRGIADPKRLAIYGGSYGGYATLAGVTFTPDLYAAAVDYVGVANLLTFMNTLPPYWEQGRKMLYEMVGNPEDPAQKAKLEAQSPINSADKIKTPLLVAQGLHDPRVNKNESDQMVKALRARGIDVPYMVKDNEGHGFHNEENRFDFYRAMEQFFGEHLGGRVAPGQDVLTGLKS